MSYNCKHSVFFARYMCTVVYIACIWGTTTGGFLHLSSQVLPVYRLGQANACLPCTLRFGAHCSPKVTAHIRKVHTQAYCEYTCTFTLVFQWTAGPHRVSVDGHTIHVHTIHPHDPVEIIAEVAGIPHGCFHMIFLTHTEFVAGQA